MRFKVKDELDFFNFVDELCIKNQIAPTNATTRHYEHSTGLTTIILGEPFLSRLRSANKADMELLVELYGDKGKT